MRMRSHALLWTGLAGLLAPVSFVSGQEQVESSSAAIVVSSDESGSGPAVMAMSFSNENGDVTFSSGEVAMVPGMALPGFSPFGSDPIGMLGNSEVMDEIELVPDQRAELERLNKEFGERISEQIKGMKDGSLSGEKARDIGEVFRKLNEEKQAAVRNVLLPHQMERLQQISLQGRMKAGGASGLLADKKLAEELGITEEQQKKLREKAEELSRQLREKIEALREQTREELLGELTAEQREKLKKMLGEKFSGSLEPSLPLPKRVRERIEQKPSKDED